MQSTLLNRGMRAAKLSRAAFEEVERDENATLQAAAVVALAAVSVGLTRRDGDLFGGLAVAVIASLLGWLAYGFLAYFAGARMLPGKQTSATPGQVLRTLGFATAPLVFWVFTAVPIFGFFLALALWLLWFAATIIALRASMELSLQRAVVVGLVALLLFGLVSLVSGTILGVDALKIGV